MICALYCYESWILLTLFLTLKIYLL